MQVKTVTLQNLIKKVSKMGVNKNIGITEYYYLTGCGDKLSITATDGNNFIEASVKTECDNIDVIVQSDSFAKIIDKTTKEVVELTVNPDHLEFIGNGTYKIPIYTGEDYPVPNYDKFKMADGFKVGIDDLKSITTVNKAAVANSPTGGSLNGYLVTPVGTITTDEKRVCFNDRVKSETPILLSKEMVNLITTISDLDIGVKYQDGQVYIASESVQIVGPELEGKETFPDTSYLIEQMDNVFNECKINKSVVVKALERLAIFVSPFDKSELIMIAEEDFIQFETYEDSFEVVNLTRKLEDSVEVAVSSNNLKEVLNSLPQEEVKLGFVGDSFIVLEVPHTKVIVATCES